jgi:membrane protease YdiL (CAAX protease family)
VSGAFADPAIDSPPGWTTRHELVPTLQTVLVVWTLLVAGGALAPWLGGSLALFVSFGAATAWMLSTRPAPRSAAWRPGLLVAGVAAGFTSYPAWIAGILWIGLGLDLAPRAATPPGAGSPLVWIGMLLLAPVFEELLYRERVLAALRGRFGTPVALVASSLLFALPHFDAWNVVGAFCVGAWLGGVHLATGSTALCIALHAGLNGAALTLGVPPLRAPLSPLASAALGGALLAAGILASRRAAASASRPGVVGCRSRMRARESGRAGPTPPRGGLGCEVVRQRGLEPPRGCPRQPLKLVRLPIPPLPLGTRRER